jgi:hypothetical protein
MQINSYEMALIIMEPDFFYSVSIFKRWLKLCVVGATFCNQKYKAYNDAPLF